MCICYGRTNLQSLRNVCLNGVPIKWQSCVKYLGNMLSYDLCDDADVSAKKCVFISVVNRLNYIFRGVSSNIKVKLLQTYCTAWYGGPTWELGTTAASSMETQWKISVRRTLGLPPRTRSILLPGLAGNLSFGWICQVTTGLRPIGISPGSWQTSLGLGSMSRYSAQILICITQNFWP